ncbi:hypothetical protein RB195_018741 [Necator americanus]|uniref:Uncharacterized protein n=1 Tax=Necator americanus TaxID=51031 RepID=A0ABR1CE08_NECAM
MLIDIRLAPYSDLRFTEKELLMQRKEKIICAADLQKTAATHEAAIKEVSTSSTPTVIVINKPSASHQSSSTHLNQAELSSHHQQFTIKKSLSSQRQRTIQATPQTPQQSSRDHQNSSTELAAAMIRLLASFYLTQRISLKPQNRLWEVQLKALRLKFSRKRLRRLQHRIPVHLQLP